MSVIVVAFGIAAAALTSALPAAWANWTDSRDVVSPPATATRLVRFVVPLGTYDKAQATLADVRVIDRSGVQVAYVVDTGPVPQPVSWTTMPVFDSGFVPGRYTQAAADLGANPAQYDSLRLDVDEAQGDFFAWVAVDASEDAHTWRIVRDRAPIFRFEADGIAGQQDVAFPESRSRYVRVRILDGAKRFGIGSISVANVAVTPIVRTTLPVPVVLSGQSSDGKSVWAADTHVKYAPVTAVRFRATQEAFHRLVTVSSSLDDQTWTQQAQAYIYRESGSSQMFIEVPGGQGRYWRVTVYNRNDAPIDGLSVQLLTTPSYVAFRQTPGQHYALIYGNDRAIAPEYDLATLTTQEERAKAALVRVGPEILNAAYVSPEPPAPWSEQHAWILWVTLIAAVVLIAAMSIRSMR